ncbi:substrate-binding domain-containing protein [Anaerotruncus rubiinfantis]|uniref:substrate-binding domain-containing protein n=1 Tax=Anaerotruncus rubiinfantis TaxID=1720200 RepID=UPI0011C9FC29|nr:substrate-binding domain-containing protein [Anaerotruncus rubiinfantis]
MKRILGITFAAMMSLSLLAGCGGSDEPSSSAAPAAPASSAAPAASEDSKGMEGPITVVSREPGSGTRGAFIELMGIEEKGADGTKTDHTTQDAVIASQTNVVMTNVAGDPNAIGYISLGSLNDTVKAVNVDGVEANAENVKAGTYKVARPFNIATKGEPTGLAKDFIDFIMSKEGQQIVVDAGYIAVADDAAAYAGDKPQGRLVIAGSSSVSPVMEKLAEAYKAVNAGAEIELQTSDSTAGMTAAIDGTCDIGMASRGLKDTESAELVGLAIANDGIAVVVSPENPVENLTSEQIKGIFTGEIIDWADAQ